MHYSLVLWTSRGLQQWVDQVDVKCAAVGQSSAMVCRLRGTSRRKALVHSFQTLIKNGTVDAHCCSGRLCSDEVVTLAARRSPEQHSDSSQTCHPCATEWSFPDPHQASEWRMCSRHVNFNTFPLILKHTTTLPLRVAISQLMHDQFIQPYLMQRSFANIVLSRACSQRSCLNCWSLRPLGLSTMTICVQRPCTQP